MKITIVKSDKFVRVDSDYINSESFDFSSLPENWHALQWEGSIDGKTGIGEIEYNAAENTRRTNVPISDITEYMKYINQAKDIIEYNKLLEIEAANAASNTSNTAI